jgi:hypothetical protein
MRGLDIVGANATSHGWWQTGLIVVAIFAAAGIEIFYLKKGRRT